MDKLRFFGIATIIIILDQAVKMIIRATVTTAIPVIGSFLTIINTTNTGAGFGILQGRRWLLIGISVLVIALLIYHLPKFLGDNSIALAFALILGGAVGNLIDRIVYGGVTDFFNLSFFPAFNVADSAITIGAAILIVLEIGAILKKKSR